MKRTIWLLLLLCICSSSVWSQQAKPQQTTKKTTTSAVKPQSLTPAPKKNVTSTTPVIPKKTPSTTPKNTTPVKPNTNAATSKKTVPKPKTNATIAQKDSVVVEVKKEEEEDDSSKPLAVYVKDTTAKYLQGNLKMGDEYITSRYTPPTITLLFINDLFDRDKKEMSTEDFMADKIEIGDKFYLNQQSITAKKKKEFLEEIQKQASASLLPKLYTGDKLSKTRSMARWSDTTFSFSKERIAYKALQSSTKDTKSKSGKKKTIQESPTDSLGNAILYALLRKDIPATTMKVWCDPKAVLQKSKDLLTTSDLAVNKDPKKKLIYQELLKQNFILVMGFSNVHEVYENIYGKDNKGRDIVIRTKPTGSYACDLSAFLYKIEMNPMTLANLGSNCDTKRIPIRYVYRATRQNFFMGAKDYTVNRRKFVNGSFVVVPEEVHLTHKEFNQRAIQSATDNIFEELEHVIDEFKMRSGVSQVKPFYAAEMGDKQGAYVDQRYDIYRYEKDISKNEVNATKVATVRMTKVAKNKGGTKPAAPSSSLARSSGLSNTLTSFTLFKEPQKNSDNAEKTKLTSNKEPTKSKSTAPKESGDSLHKWSHFKPITLGNIQKGDFLLQNDDKGITALAGYNYNNLYPSLTLGLELNINVLLKTKGLPSGLKLGAWLNPIINDYKFEYYDKEDGKYKENKSYFTIYLAKDFYLTRLVDVSPFVAYEFAGSSQGIRVGTQVPLNVFKGRVKLSPHVSVQTLSQLNESARLCFGAITKVDF